ncbi:MAG: hypothetical protein R2860_04775 [Desulfobacterales bacterium]
MSDFGDQHRYNVTGLYHDMWGFPSENPKIVYGLIRHLVDKIENNSHQIARFRKYYVKDADILLISYGAAARSALHLVENRRRRGEKLGLTQARPCGPFLAK